MNRSTWWDSLHSAHPTAALLDALSQGRPFRPLGAGSGLLGPGIRQHITLWRGAAQGDGNQPLGLQFPAVAGRIADKNLQPIVGWREFHGNRR